MENMVTTVNQLLAGLTILGQLLLVGILWLIYWRKQAELRKLFKLMVDQSTFFAWLIALTATVGSLFYSEIAGYTPCKLCWWQRIFMYPLILLFALSLHKKDRSILPYALLLSIVGGVIAAYHYAMQRGFLPSLVCSISGAADCSREYVLQFDYVTIPLMSLTAFALIALLSFVGWRFSKK
jgi:disulfide bond formation protein DsbB